MKMPHEWNFTAFRTHMSFPRPLHGVSAYHICLCFVTTCRQTLAELNFKIVESFCNFCVMCRLIINTVPFILTPVSRAFTLKTKDFIKHLLKLLLITFSKNTTHKYHYSAVTSTWFNTATLYYLNCTFGSLTKVPMNGKGSVMSTEKTESHYTAI